MNVALVLGAGGVLGGAWQIGALHAIREETGWDPRQADYLIGTSAGALVAALLAAGVLPEIDLVDATERRIRGIPLPVPGSPALAINGLRSPNGRRWLLTAAGLLPRGVLSTAPIERAVSRRIPEGWPAGRRLWIVAADYRSGERVVFGRAHAPAATLAAAVAASCAIPGVYQPVRIDAGLYVDGGLYSPDNLDLLAGCAVDLAICISPLSSAFSGATPTTVGDRLLLRAEKAAHRRLGATTSILEDSGTSVLLIEPGQDDLHALGLNMMNRTRVGQVMETAMKTVAGQVRSARERGVLDTITVTANR